MLSVSELFIYPIKSLAGIAVQQAEICKTGLQYDRKWMLIDDNNRFISQREVAGLALLQVEVNQSFIFFSSNKAVQVSSQIITSMVSPSAFVKGTSTKSLGVPFW